MSNGIWDQSSYYAYHHDLENDTKECHHPTSLVYKLMKARKLKEFTKRHEKETMENDNETTPTHMIKVIGVILAIL